MVNIDVGQLHGAEFQSTVQIARIGEKMCDMRPKTADRTLFNRKQRHVFTRHARNQFNIQRFHEPRIDNACAPALSIQPFGGLHGVFQPRAIAQKTYAATFTDDSTPANFQRRAARRSER